MWVPGHSDIAGNGMTDVLAREGTYLPFNPRQVQTQDGCMGSRVTYPDRYDQIWTLKNRHNLHF